MKIFSLTLVLFSLNSFAYRPSFEALLKNPNNPLMSKNTTVATIKVTELGSDHSFFQRVVFSDKISPDMMNLTTYYGNTTQLVHQANTNIWAVAQANPAAALIYSWLKIFTRNNPDWMLKFLRNSGVEIKKQEQNINHQKLGLINEYKNFVYRQRKNPKLTDDKSPLTSTERSRQREINDILNSPFYHNQEKADIIKKENQFFWQIQKNGYLAQFDLNNRRLETNDMTLGENQFSLVVGQYEPYEGSFEVPKQWGVALNDRRFKIEIISVRQLDINSSQWSDLIKTDNLTRAQVTSGFPEIIYVK
jgi:hypothetical protein